MRSGSPGSLGELCSTEEASPCSVGPWPYRGRKNALAEEFLFPAEAENPLDQQFWHFQSTGSLLDRAMDLPQNKNCYEGTKNAPVEENLLLRSEKLFSKSDKRYRRTKNAVGATYDGSLSPAQAGSRNGRESQFPPSEDGGYGSYAGSAGGRLTCASLCVSFR